MSGYYKIRNLWKTIRRFLGLKKEPPEDVEDAYESLKVLFDGTDDPEERKGAIRNFLKN